MTEHRQAASTLWPFRDEPRAVSQKGKQRAEGPRRESKLLAWPARSARLTTLHRERKRKGKPQGATRHPEEFSPTEWEDCGALKQTAVCVPTRIPKGAEKK
ncbi:hypothetical protein EYF80_009190 [Liparis tanakae]|uniref:Uncharacterized protein n=1 Tax=Liparis tanakae TaxID=230148 RepID=A0A4Z2IRI6_9TELE|nr:hypothetical protein EYF80_009190 [Liparis tanakae]